jgi:hypothetical protein
MSGWAGCSGGGGRSRAAPSTRMRSARLPRPMWPRSCNPAARGQLASPGYALGFVEVHDPSLDKRRTNTRPAAHLTSTPRKVRRLHQSLPAAFFFGDHCRDGLP